MFYMSIQYHQHLNKTISIQNTCSGILRIILLFLLYLFLCKKYIDDNNQVLFILGITVNLLSTTTTQHQGQKNNKQDPALGCEEVQRGSSVGDPVRFLFAQAWFTAKNCLQSLDFPDELSKFKQLFIALPPPLCMYLVFAPHHLAAYKLVRIFIVFTVQIPLSNI